MPWQVTAALLALLVAIPVFGVAVWLISRSLRRRSQIMDRLGVGGPEELTGEEIRHQQEDDPGGWASDLLDILMLSPVANLYSRWLRKAGFANSNAPAFFFIVKLILMTASVISLYTLPPEYNPVQVKADLPMMAALSAFAMWVGLDMMLWRRMKRRQILIETDIPFWLDLHATLVEGGMGFDQALSRFVSETELFTRPLFIELRQMFREIELGASRLDALKSMGRRVDVESLDTVIAAIVQGEQLGGGIVDTLRAQADMMRNKVWEESRERAQKLPVKMLFPMVIGILPSIFLVTVAPSFLKLIGLFGTNDMGF